MFVILEFTLSLALALNFFGFFAGTFGKGIWLFLPAHLLALGLSALLCTSSVILLYNLCLRWFGRERLDSFMTTLQVLLVVGFTVSSQIIPRITNRVSPEFFQHLPSWTFALPPAWFAAVDVLASGRIVSIQMAMLAALGAGATLLITWLSVSVLADSYQQGLAVLNEAGPPGGSWRRSARTMPAAWRACLRDAPLASRPSRASLPSISFLPD